MGKKYADNKLKSNKCLERVKQPPFNDPCYLPMMFGIALSATDYFVLDHQENMSV